MKFMPKLLGALVGAVALSAPTTRAQSIVDIAAGDEQFSTLVAAVTAADLVDTLSGDGTFTVFAPTNEAFEGVDVARLVEPEWKAHLTDILLYHVLGTEVLSTDLTEVGQMAETLQGSSVTVTSLDPVQIDNAEVIAADIEADNGVVHVVDDVLLPPSATNSIVDLAVADNATFSTLVELLIAANLTEVLSSEGPFTVFAPTNEAFAELDDELVESLLADPSGLLTNVLLYHVVPGNVLAADLVDGSSVMTALGGSNLTFEVDDGEVEINGDSDVIFADVLANNGVIHVIDEVLIPPPAPAPTPTDETPMEEGDGEMEEVTSSIVDIAVGNEDFSTLVDLLTAAGLVEALQGEGPFTVFAPTNDAFAALDEATLAAVGNDTELLTSVLLYHVLDGEVLSTDLVDGAMVMTLNGATVEVSLDPVMINDANVVMADIMGTNGVVHVIDAVLIPPPADEMVEPEEETDMEEVTSSIVDIAVGNQDFSTLVGLLTAAGLVETLQGDGPFTVFAPTNDAFAALDEATLAAVGTDTELLTSVLLYHVLDGEVLSTDLVDGAMVLTLNGATVDISLDPVMINDANVVVADIMGTNGVVHVIDKVLIPPSDEAPAPAPAPVSSDGFQRIASADLEESACIEIAHGVAVARERLILGDCTADMGGWSLEDSGLIRSELDTDFCMQADFSSTVKEGTPMRVMPCDADNELQKFTFVSGEGIRPTTDDDFCFSWRGVTANIGSDPIIAKPCDDIEDLLDWKFE